MAALGLTPFSRLSSERHGGSLFALMIPWPRPALCTRQAILAEVFPKAPLDAIAYIYGFCRDWVRTVKIPKRIAKRRAELESEGYQVLPPDPCHGCTLPTSPKTV